MLPRVAMRASHIQRVRFPETSQQRKPWMLPRCSLALLILVHVGSCLAYADTLFLRGGEKLIGQVESESAAAVVFQSQTLGRLEVPRDRVERIEREAAPLAVAPLSTNPTPNSPPPQLVRTDPFRPAPLGSSGDHAFDWIQLKSGEWLKGKVKSLQDEKLEFDSEELDLLGFDWKNILAVRSPRLNSVRIENLRPVEGAVFVTTNEVQVVTSTSTNIYPRADLLAITPTGNRELDKWTGKMFAGVSFRAGNTREVDLSAEATLQRRTPDTRLYLDYLLNYGKVNGEQIEQNHQFVDQFDYFLSRRLYVRVPDLQYYRDPLENLAHRLTVGAGVGYDLFKTSRTEWNVTASPSWQRNWFDSVPAGESPTADSAALVLSTRFDTELTQRLDLIFDYRGQITSRENGNSTHDARLTLEFEVHKRLKLDLTYIWNRITEPKTEYGGATPASDDFRLITSLGVDF